MKPIRMYVQEAIDRGLVKNQSDLGTRLGVTRATVSDWVVGRTSPSEDQAATLAELLGKPEILAECMAHRAKRPETRAAWERAARALATTTAYGALVAVNFFLPHSPANAAPLLEMAGRTIGIMSTWRACLSRRWRRRPGRAGAPAPSIRLAGI